MTLIEEFAEVAAPANWEHKWEPDCAIPLSWAADVVHMARKRNLITSDILAELILKVCCDLRIIPLSRSGILLEFS